MTFRIENILFPFYKKCLFLKKYWWHRLFVVLFFVAIITIGIFPSYSAIRYHNARNASCWNAFNSDIKSNGDGYAKEIQTFGIDTATGLNKATDDFINGGLNICLDSNSSSFPLDLKFALIFGIIFMLLVSYVLQLVYYKIFIYIIFGKNYDSSKDTTRRQ